jgi:hypothetical protein
MVSFAAPAKHRTTDRSTAGGDPLVAAIAERLKG